MYWIWHCGMPDIKTAFDVTITIQIYNSIIYIISIIPNFNDRNIIVTPNSVDY